MTNPKSIRIPPLRDLRKADFARRVNSRRQRVSFAYAAACLVSITLWTVFVIWAVNIALGV
jgi:hypothetical protein